MTEAMKASASAVSMRQEYGRRSDSGRDRPDQVPRSVQTRSVVGADGMHSTVRRAANIGFTAGRYAQAFLLADVRMDWPLPPTKVQFFSADGLVDAAQLRPDSSLTGLVPSEAGFRRTQQTTYRFGERDMAADRASGSPAQPGPPSSFPSKRRRLHGPDDDGPRS